MDETRITRRRAIAAIAALSVVPMAGRGETASLPTIVVSKDPNCGCCGAWVDHLRTDGFSVEVKDTPELNRVKARLGVPHDLQACHTAEAGGYIIEGHVPAAAVRRVLEEMPQAKGLAVPGMPVGSPGMEVEGSEPQEYTVFLFGDFGRRPYVRYRETRELSH